KVPLGIAPIPSAPCQFCAIAHENPKVPVGPFAHFANGIEANNGGAVDTKELCGVETFRERTNSSTQAKLLITTSEYEIVLFGFDAIDAVNRQELCAAIIHHENASKKCRRRRYWHVLFTGCP